MNILLGVSPGFVLVNVKREENGAGPHWLMPNRSPCSQNSHKTGRLEVDASAVLRQTPPLDRPAASDECPLDENTVGDHAAEF